MAGNKRKLTTLKGKVLTVILGVVGTIYWLIGKAENAIESLYQS